MNRYLITQTGFREKEYQVLALCDTNKKLLEAELHSLEQSALLGSIYIGRVEKIVTNINAAFVKISSTQTCYLSLEDFHHPIFTKKLSKTKPLVQGDELLVQIYKEAVKTKDPVVTTNLNFSGRYCVLTSGNGTIGVSGKLSKNQKSHYQELLAPVLTQEFGVIVRTNAATVPDDMLLAELDALRENFTQIAAIAPSRTCYSCLYQSQEPYLQQLNQFPAGSMEEVVTDLPDVFEKLCEFYQIPDSDRKTRGSVSSDVYKLQTSQGFCLHFYQDDTFPLSAMYQLEHGLTEALQERVWLKSGAYLIIQPTEALTVIDVNTGKNNKPRSIEENFLAVNIEAAEEIARQLRLRNISGIILIDFINLKTKTAQETLLTELRQVLKKDPVRSEVIDMTPLGLVEVTRKKIKKSLKEML